MTKAGDKIKLSGNGYILTGIFQGYENNNIVVVSESGVLYKCNKKNFKIITETDKKLKTKRGVDKT
jgi:hypothetical protein